MNAGLDIRLYDANLHLVHEYFRRTKDNSIKFMIQIKHGRLVLATNHDLEAYTLFEPARIEATVDTAHRSPLVVTNEAYSIRALKKYANVHDDSISCLMNVNEEMFASGASNGITILWQAETMIRSHQLVPFVDFRKPAVVKAPFKLPLTKFGLTGLVSVRAIDEVPMKCCFVLLFVFYIPLLIIFEFFIVSVTCSFVAAST